jgi:aspartyl-tRNA(Asn)/glutamyl-tRNA(Gln) amidotransferase subunit B
MEEGSLRCDANISVRLRGATTLGTKVEVKNLNSIRNVKRAIEAEANRQTGILERNETVVQQTRSFDATRGTTFSIRDKEDADDYRYFAEPDLTPFELQEEFIESVRRTIPELPSERIKKYTAILELSDYDAQVLTEEKIFSDYFDEMIRIGTRPKAAANWMIGPVKSWLNEENKSIEEFPVPPGQLSRLIDLIESGKVSFTTGSTKLLTALIADPGNDPGEMAAEKGFLQQSDMGAIESLIDEVLSNYADKVLEYKKGKKGLLSLFVGEVMKRSRGKADPQMTNELLLNKLKSL